MGKDNPPKILGRNVTLEQIRTFILVSTMDNFSEAAEELHRTQSAVTQTIKKLEDLLGFKLLERRRGKFIKLTEKGEIFLNESKKIIAQVDESFNSINNLINVKTIKIAVPNDINIPKLYEILSQTPQIEPNLRFEIQSALCSEIKESINSKNIDIAILKSIKNKQLKIKSHATHLLKEDSLQWISSQKFKFNELSEVPLILFPEKCEFRESAIHTLQSNQKKYHLAYTSSSYDKIFETILSGIGVGILPLSSIKNDTLLLDDFPNLPDIQLILLEVSTQPLINEISKSIVNNIEKIITKIQ